MTFTYIYPEESTIHFHETLSSVSGTNAINTMMLIRVTKIKKETLEKSSDNVTNIYFFHQMFFLSQITTSMQKYFSKCFNKTIIVISSKLFLMKREESKSFTQYHFLSFVCKNTEFKLQKIFFRSWKNVSMLKITFET